MNILEGIKSISKPTTTSTKFIIKSKPSFKENKGIDTEESSYSSCNEANQLITYMVNKSKRLTELLEARGVEDETDFHTKNMYNNPCMRTLLKAVMDKMLADRRLGKNLKGMNKSLLSEIENSVWQGVEREVNLYLLNKQYEEQKGKLEHDIDKRRKEIENKIKNLSLESPQKPFEGLREVQINIEDF